MGTELVGFYQQANEIGSLKAGMRMALLTGITSLKANSAEDSPENIAKFEEALQEIQKEFAN